MDLPSRYSLEPLAFHKADEQIAADEKRWPKLHGDGLPRRVSLPVRFETPYLDKLYRALVEGK
jgi:hypothetical protein